MANDAFALSPISASGTLPSEADYQAISEAFMETSRGRWFLKEYARRNRNADTALVLDAVARVESIVAAQKQEPAPPPAPPFADTLEAIRSTVDEARATASKALAELQSDTALAPAHKGLRVILEVAWRLREIGYDTRICDILETQARAIAAGHDALAGHDGPATVLASFDLIARKISELTDETAPEPAPAPVAENVVSLWPSSPTISEATTVEPAEAAAIAIESPVSVSTSDTPVAHTEGAEDTIVPIATIAPMESPAEAVAETELADTGIAETLVAASADAATAAIADETLTSASMSDPSMAGTDEAVAPTSAIEPQAQTVEAVAETALAETGPAETGLAETEMAATAVAEPESVAIAALSVETPADASVTDTPFASMEEAVVAAATIAPAVQPLEAVAEAQATEPAITATVETGVETPIDAMIAASRASTQDAVVPVAAIEPPPSQPTDAVAEIAVAESQADVEPPVSLGSALIALGMVSNPLIRSDPLAPLRRMSQAERIAFFS